MTIIENKKLLKIILFVSIILFTFILRHQYLNVPVLIVDEALYGEIANVILDGGVPYRDAWEQKPPGIYFLYALIFLIFGRNNLIAVHWIAAFTIALTAIGIFCFASIVFSRRTALISAFFYCAITSCGSAAHFQAANTEIFSVFFAIWALFFFFKENNKFTSLFICGILTALSFFFKQPGGLVIILFAVYLFIKNLTRKQVFLKNFLTILSGFFTVTFITVFYFFINNALYDLWMVGFWHNILYMKGNDIGFGLIAMKKNIPLFVNGNYIFYFPAFFMFLFSLFKFIKAKLNLNRIDSKYIVMLLWFPLSFLSTSLGWRFEGHYFYFLFPALCVLSGNFFDTLYNYLYKRKKYYAYFLNALYIIAFSYSLIYHTGFPPGFQKKYWVFMDLKENQGNFISAISQYIRHHTSKKDTIFVWGFCPEIYTMSDRRCASRFIFCNFLVGQMTGDKYFHMNEERLDRTIPGAWQKLMTDLNKNMPEYIIDTSTVDYFKYDKYPVSRFYMLKNFINENYTYLGKIFYVDVYKLKT